LEIEAKYKYTRAYHKIRDLIMNNPDEDVFVIRGGQGASKTISILQLIIQSLSSSPKKATVLSSELSKMKRTVVMDYKEVAKDWGVLPSEQYFNRSESKHEYVNGSYLEFLGADVSDVGKGLRRDILYINEADKMGIETAVQFISRADITIIDYNPDSLFWGDDYINENNFLTLTFEDNEYLKKSEVKSILGYKDKGFYNPDLKDLFNEQNIKSKYWSNRWKVYGLGLVGMIEGVVFEDWEDGEFDTSLPYCFGMDFGFHPSPTTLVKVAVDFKRKLIYVDEKAHATSLSMEQIVSVCKDNIPQRDLVICDCAGKREISELRKERINALKCNKGDDSVRTGIKNMMDYKIIVTPASLNIKRELRNYVWNDKKAGIPVKASDHCVDSFRYAFEYLNKIKR